MWLLYAWPPGYICRRPGNNIRQPKHPGVLHQADMQARARRQQVARTPESSRGRASTLCAWQLASTTPWPSPAAARSTPLVMAALAP